MKYLSSEDYQHTLWSIAPEILPPSNYRHFYHITARLKPLDPSKPEFQTLTIEGHYLLFDPVTVTRMIESEGSQIHQYEYHPHSYDYVTSEVIQDQIIQSCKNFISEHNKRVELIQRPTAQIPFHEDFFKQVVEDCRYLWFDCMRSNWKSCP